MTESEPHTDANGLEVIAFQLASDQYAVESRYAREVHPLKHLTPIPCTPVFFLGVINVRGQLCPVVDLRRLLGLPVRGLTNASYALVIHDAALELALAVDAIVGVRSLGHDELAQPYDDRAGGNDVYFHGVTADRLALLDAERILSHPSILVNETVSP